MKEWKCLHIKKKILPVEIKKHNTKAPMLHISPGSTATWTGPWIWSFPLGGYSNEDILMRPSSKWVTLLDSMRKPSFINTKEAWVLPMLGRCCVCCPLLTFLLQVTSLPCLPSVPYLSFQATPLRHLAFLPWNPALLCTHQCHGVHHSWAYVAYPVIPEIAGLQNRAAAIKQGKQSSSSRETGTSA